MSDRDKDVEILALRHQLAVLQRHLGPSTVTFTPADRAFLAALLHPLPRQTLRRLQLLVRPDTVLRRHRDLIKRRHAHISKPKRRGRPAADRALDPRPGPAPGRRESDHDHPDRATPLHPRDDQTRHPPDPHPGHDCSSNRGVGDPGGQEPGDGPGRRRRQGQVPDPGPGREVPRPVRPDPGRCGNRHRPHRRPHATHELDHANGGCGPAAGNSSTAL
jgi:hypothetical protein